MEGMARLLDYQVETVNNYQCGEEGERKAI